MFSFYEKLDEMNKEKISRLENRFLFEFLERFLTLCNPEKIFICDDSEKDYDYIRKKALENGEERELKIKGHTIHFDNYKDQGRDKKNTGILIDKDEKLDEAIETKDRETALKDIENILKDIMKGKEAFVCFFSLGPSDSIFSIPAVQITDSAYVAHSETILYRKGYAEFLKRKDNPEFFKFVHSQGELDERKTCKNLNLRRIYIDLKENIVYSANTQYGGNTIGLKKLAMRLAINKASKEGWLTEHMLIMAVHGKNKRKTYFLGAFPSLCGKTSTAMLENEKIVGDDIAYLRKIDGVIRAVNVEKGMFGIIQGINSKDDPYIYKALHSEGEIIFSNVLVTEEGNVHWIGKDGDVPEKGENHSGLWFKGKRDEDGKEIPVSHPNARFTLSLDLLENLDEALNDKDGVEVGAIVYGGRDSDTWVPVEEAFDWEHGIITKGASLESETTAATIGKEGIREFNPMSNLDFLSIPIGRYIKNNLDFGKNLKRVPKIFGVNYFLKDKSGKYLNERVDKRVWYKWMEGRVHNDFEVIKSPTGYIPVYEDLKMLFKEVLDKEYSIENYSEQFMIRVKEHIEKIERITKIYKTKVLEVPVRLYEVLEEQKERLIEYQRKFGDYISPIKLKK